MRDLWNRITAALHTRAEVLMMAKTAPKTEAPVEAPIAPNAVWITANRDQWLAVVPDSGKDGDFSVTVNHATYYRIGSAPDGRGQYLLER
jgi:hypothetical protein